MVVYVAYFLTYTAEIMHKKATRFKPSSIQKYAYYFSIFSIMLLIARWLIKLT